MWCNFFKNESVPRFLNLKVSFLSITFLPQNSYVFWSVKLLERLIALNYSAILKITF
jgi:hypothetical protein